jgi:RNA polymerase sigma-70 factor (sigma-E family)
VSIDGEQVHSGIGREPFREFVVAHGAHLLRVAFLLTGDRSAAEDLRQEVLEGLYVAWPRVRDPFSYARTAMTRRAVNRWRLRARRGETALLGDWLRPVPDPAQSVVDRSSLVQALAELPPRQRAVLVLRYFEDLTEADAAAALGCSVGTVKSQTSRALARLRGVMSTERTTDHTTDHTPRTSAFERATSGGS